ncbi:AlwI family type II restriction endonuclease [Candidatus Neomarinimicrobiota bacterium]
MTIYQRLRSYNQYLANYPINHRSTHFEELICQGFASSFRIPFFDIDTDDTNNNYRMTWMGSANSASRAPGGPDGIGRAHEFTILVEATLKTGTRQWSQEFAQCINHAQDYANNNSIDLADLYILLVITNLHNDTYQAIQSYSAHSDLKFVLIEIDTLRITVETSLLACTIRHLEMRCLFEKCISCLSESNSIQNYRARIQNLGEEWQKDVLNLEKNVMLSIKSYEAMLKEQGDHIGVSQIFLRLARHPYVRWYLGKIDCSLNDQIISKSLRIESLGAVVGKLPQGEEIFCPVPLIEFKNRCQRRLQAVEGAHER